jgi:hypothetical protein
MFLVSMMNTRITITPLVDRPFYGPASIGLPRRLTRCGAFVLSLLLIVLLARSGAKIESGRRQRSA